MRLTKEAVIADYNYFKSKAISYCQNGDIEKSVKFTELAARIGYKFSFKYADEELEENIQKFGKIILSDKINYQPLENKIVFYDSFALDNRGLTQQYLRAIFSLNSELLFITTRLSIGIDILNELNDYPKSKIVIISGNSFAEKIETVAKSISTFKPSKVFLHFSPWDIIGFTLWSQVKSSERYFINLTDHAYWLGKNTFDYILEFRKYGCQISLNHRNIESEKLIMQPYYPLETKKAFNGLPVEKGDKMYAFSGANFYKIYGKDYFFLNLIMEVLCQNEKLIFFFAGNGDNKPLLRFIKTNKLEDRFILIGNRNDLSEVFQRIDIYVNTYPMIGGLMSQYAAFNGVPIIGFSNPDNYSFNDTENFLGIEQSGLIVKSSKKDFIEYFNLLINNKEERTRNINYTKNAVISVDNFTKLLTNNLSDAKSLCDLNFKNNDINDEEVFQIYYDMEINYLKEYNGLIIDTLGIDIFKCNISFIFRTIFGINGKLKILLHRFLNKFDL